MIKKDNFFIDLDLNSKKGMSRILLILLMMLLVFAVVIIIWIVVVDFVKKGSEQIGLSGFAIDVEIEKVTIEGEEVNVVVFLRKNPAKENLIGINFLFFDGTISEIIRHNVTMNELEKRGFAFYLEEINLENLEEVSIVPIYKSPLGRENIGDIEDTYWISKK